MIFSKEFEDIVGKAANSGSAVHKCIEIFHAQRKSFDDCMDLAKLELASYPLADWDEVRLHFRGYYGDPRNQNAQIRTTEKKFQITDSQEETAITFQGTFDQIRLDNGMELLYDVKTGKSLDAYNMLMEHTLQLACYWLGAVSLGYKVEGVGIIYTYGYRIRGADLPAPDGVFLRHPLRYEDCRTVLKGVFRQVRMLRAGDVTVTPGAHCSICPARSVATCLPLLSERNCGT